MSLKQAIETAYAKWEKSAKGATIYIEPKSSNFLIASAKLKKLKDDLCKFADKFDNHFVGNIEGPLTEEIIDDFYQDIRDDFVGRIA